MIDRGLDDVAVWMSRYMSTRSARFLIYFYGQIIRATNIMPRRDFTIHESIDNIIEAFENLL